MSITYPAVSVAGSIVTSGLLHRLGEGDSGLPHTSAESYGFGASESVRRLANRSYIYLRETWQEFAKLRQRRSGDPSAKETRDRWLLILLRELGYDGVTTLAAGIAVEDKQFPISHEWHAVPMHLLGWGTDLDHRDPRVSGPAGQAPHSLVQQMLNQSTRHLWAILSDGQRLRLLRDSTSLVGAAYLEFDLAAIFDGELFADFVLMYRLAHSSRLTVRDEETGPASCVLERWRTVGIQEGERALAQLRDGVKEALEILGTGFLDHPDNSRLRSAIGTEWSEIDFQRSLLRLIYRLLFWFVVEDRDLLLDPAADVVAEQRYAEFFSSRRLRDLALARRHGRHRDLWQQVQLVFTGLGGTGLPQLGLPPLGGLFTTTSSAQPGEPLPLDKPLHGAHLTNAALLRAVEALSVLPEAAVGGRRRRVDFRHLDAEELGGVYEDLLAQQPRWDPEARKYHLERLAGNERKTTGSYYTPSSLVECLLGSALDPLIDEAVALNTAEERVEALLSLTVCDPACGSGHFLIAAARRIAKAVAAEETGDPEPTPQAIRHATRRVIGRCIYGVDVNEMAAELAKVSLWLETMEPGKPLGYLDANIRVGNSLLGVTPTLLKAGIPDKAYSPLDGDNRKLANALRSHRAQEKADQLPLHAEERIRAGNATLATAAEAITSMAVNTLTDVHTQEQRAAELDDARRRQMLIADAWCAAFVQYRTPELAATLVTETVLRRLEHDLDQSDLSTLVEAVRKVAAQYRFFHWQVEFPHIFRVPETEVGPGHAGWDGGFSLVIGNPPWEMIELKDEEFFASRAPAIAEAPNAAARNRAILELSADSATPEDRALYREYVDAFRMANGTRWLLRASGRFPHTGQGRINTHAVFAETARTIVHPRGQVGLILPTGIATDATTQGFFQDLVRTQSLVSLYDFENENKVFPGVHHSVRFALLTVSGTGRPSPQALLAFRAREVAQIAARTYVLTPQEIILLNPNTGTCPVFTSRRDAEITLGIYRRLPVLWRGEEPEGNLWDVWFRQGLFNMATDSGRFRTADKLIADGWRLQGNVFVRGDDRMLPLYEAKMARFFDHRFSTYEGATEAQLNVGILPRLSDADHDDPARVPRPRYWVAEFGTKEKPGVENRLARRWKQGWLLGWRDIARSTDERTLISTVIPRTAVGHKFPLAFVDKRPACLAANLSSFVLDYIARQKLSGTSMSYFVVKQLPVFPPEAYDETTPWDQVGGTLDAWVTARVLELTCTSYDITAYAHDLGDAGEPFRWDPQRRQVMRAELDAAYFHLYGVEREDVEHIMGTFPLVAADSKQLIQELYEEMATAMRTGKAYQTRLHPPPGHGPRHPVRAATHA